MAEATVGITPQLYQAIMAVVDERIREIQVTREDFHELKGIVQELAEAQRELAEAQARTEQRLDRLEAVVGELAQAQRELVQVQTNFARTFDRRMIWPVREKEAKDSLYANHENHEN